MRDFTLSDLADFITAGATKNVESFESPDEDLVPIAFMFRENRDTVAVMLPTEFFSNVEGKNILAKALVPAAFVWRIAAAVGLILSTWQVVVSDEMAEREFPGVAPEDVGEAIIEHYGSLGASPFAREVAFVAVYDQDDVVTRRATMHRNQDGTAYLDEWEETGVFSLDHDRFGGPIVATLREMAAA